MCHYLFQENIICSSKICAHLVKLLCDNVQLPDKVAARKFKVGSVYSTSSSGIALQCIH